VKITIAIVLSLAMGSAQADPHPRTVEKGGGVGRMFAWTTMLLGITGGAAAGGVYFAASQDLSDCQQHTLLGLGCEQKQKNLDDATNFATLGGIGAGALVGTSIVLFVVTDPRHTEVVYDDPEPEGLPIGAYVATGATLAGAITAQVIMNGAASDLGSPSKHMTMDDTASLVSRYHYARYAAGGLYLAAAGFAAMSAWQTVKVERAPQLSLAPLRGGAYVGFGGHFCCAGCCCSSSRAMPTRASRARPTTSACPGKRASPERARRRARTCRMRRARR
jgi:hypothetical protein